MKDAFWEAYNLYLQSDEWKAKREKILGRRGRKCFACKEKKTGLQLHHVTYERVGHERNTDLVILCKECHEIAHEHGGGWKGVRRAQSKSKSQRKSDKKITTIRRKAFVTKMLSGPVKVYSPDEIASFQEG